MTHTSTEQPEALLLADWLDDQYDPDHYKAAAATELRRQHARIAELDGQLTGCIQLLKRTPKITQDIYVGKDRQAWGVQAKAVLAAAIAVQAKQGGEQQ